MTPPCKIEATRPMYPSKRPFSADVYPNRSYVMKGKENSIPEKKRINAKCVRLSRKCEFVLWSSFFPSLLEDDLVNGFVGPLMAAGALFAFVSATLLGRVSGR